MGDKWVQIYGQKLELRYKYQRYDYHNIIQKSSTSETIQFPGVSSINFHPKESPLYIKIFAQIRIHYTYLITNTWLYYGF